MLAALRGDPFLGDLFVMHGGTALNLFHDDAPRLSVDIDLMFVGEVELEAMRRVRPEVDARLREVVGALGYVVQATNAEHSGQTYRIKYSGDYVKIDITYLARVTMLMPELCECAFADPAPTFPVLQLPELVAGKVKAMMDRVAGRDLFDLYRLAGRLPDLFADPLSRALVIWAACASGPFPFVTDPSASLERFRNPSAEITGLLYAVLRTDDIVDWSDMLTVVAQWLTPLGALVGAETEFVNRLREDADCQPGILFSDRPDIAERAVADPVMSWKVKNLRTLLE